MGPAEPGPALTQPPWITDIWMGSFVIRARGNATCGLVADWVLTRPGHPLRAARMPSRSSARPSRPTMVRCDAIRAGTLVPLRPVTASHHACAPPPAATRKWWSAWRRASSGRWHRGPERANADASLPPAGSRGESRRAAARLLDAGARRSGRGSASGGVRTPRSRRRGSRPARRAPRLVPRGEPARRERATQRWRNRRRGACGASGARWRSASRPPGPVEPVPAHAGPRRRLCHPRAILPAGATPDRPLP